MSIDKKSLKLLKLIYKKQTFPYIEMIEFLKKHPSYNEILKSESFAPYIELRGEKYPTQKDEDGFPIGQIDYSESYYVTTMLGNIEVEKSIWFTVPYVINSLIVPIIVGIFSSVITAIILSFLI